jgi:uncharacterized membrane protein
MVGLLVLLGVYLAVVLVVLPIVTVIKLVDHRERIRELLSRTRGLEGEIKRLNATVRELSEALLARLRETAAPAGSAPVPAPIAAGAAASKAGEMAPVPIPAPVRLEPPPLMMAASAASAAAGPPGGSLPPPLAASPTTGEPASGGEAPVKPFNWEQFMGAKLFAWLGGLALFLCIAFFVKYSFEHDLIPPEVRVALGFLLGLGLIVGGLKITPERYRVTAQSLVAAGVVSLYAVTFACDSIYHFAFFGPIPTFLVMALVTVVAFLIAVRREAQVVAVLGILGAFLTPVLINTGHDNPAGLFGYIALLVAGVSAVTIARGWSYLVALSAAGTVLMILGWADAFLVPGKVGIAVVVCLGFGALFFAVYRITRKREAGSVFELGSTLLMSAFALGFAFYLVEEAGLGVHPGLLLCLAFGADLLLLAVAWDDERLPRLHLAAGLAVFALLADWTLHVLTSDLLPWALAASLVFAALHAAYPLVLERRRPESAAGWWHQLYPPLALLLLLFPIFRFAAVSFLVWPAILLVDGIAIAVAVLTASLLSVAAVLVLTLVGAAAVLLRIPPQLTVEPSLLLVIGFFAVFFFGAGLWLVRRLEGVLPDRVPGLRGVLANPSAQIPALSSLLPFILLIMASVRLGVSDPSPLFGLGLLLVVLTLGLARLLGSEWLPACALAGAGALEYTWHASHAATAAPGAPVAWYLVFYAVFAGYPFVFRKTFARCTGPWAVAALSGPVHFWMVYHTIRLGWPNGVLGLVPAAFAAAPLASLVAILRRDEADAPRRMDRLAWFGGASLFFITLIVPVQFDRQWITVGWALEGAALLWLYHRVPHPGLRITGAGLLAVVFVRLAFNPAVLSYHLRGDVPLLNWYLYAYGVSAASLFAGGWLLTPPRERILGINVRPILYGLGVILTFILLNIEIADYFTLPGAPTLAFEFSGDFARDMSYTIGWALFALGLLVAGIAWNQKTARYAAIGLLSAALLKLFLHDLARLEALYRVGALFGVAVVAIVASFAYQRFLPSHEKNPSGKA